MFLMMNLKVVHDIYLIPNLMIMGVTHKLSPYTPSPGLEKVWYDILFNSKLKIWQPIFGLDDGPVSHHLRVSSQILGWPMTQPDTKQS